MTEVGPGDIVAVAKLKDTATGDTLCDEKDAGEVPEPLPVARPVITFALKPKAQGRRGQDRPARCTASSRRTRPSRSAATRRPRRCCSSGMGQVHVEITVEKMKRKFGVEVELAPPQGPLPRDDQGPRRGRRGQAQEADRRPRPVRRLLHRHRADRARRGLRVRRRHRRRRRSRASSSPRSRRASANRMARGVLAGFPVVDVKVPLSTASTTTSTRPTSPSRWPAPRASRPRFKQCQAHPARADREARGHRPRRAMGDVIGDINQRRGRVLGMDAQGRNQIIKAQSSPCPRCLKYAPDLRSMTGGRGDLHHGVLALRRAPRPRSPRR